MGYGRARDVGPCAYRTLEQICHGDRTAPNKPSGSETKPEPKPEQKPGALPSTGDATTVLGVFAALPGIAALAGGALLRKKR